MKNRLPDSVEVYRNSPGMSIVLILLGLISILFVAGALSFMYLQNAEEIGVTAISSVETDGRTENERSASSNQDGKYGQERSEEILDFYLKKLEKDEEEQDLIETGLNVLFAVANEAQNLALDTLEMPEQWSEDAPDQLHDAILKEYKLSKNLLQKRKLEQILKRLKRFAPNSAPNFKIYLIKEEEPNAFAIAGGRIYVTTGLLDFVGSDDELAAIVGHEMAHVYKGHCHRKLKTLALADSALGELGTLAANIGILLTAPFGQSDELEADKEGRELATEAGFRRSGMKKFLERLDKAEGGDGNLLDKMTRSHPFSSERIEYLNED